jgi:alpha-tubulin suppressor-like RCC1 family protein
VGRIELGEHHSCVILSSGAVRCWGSNAYGQLGNGTTADHSTTPVAVSGLSTVDSIALGAWHSCAFITPTSSNPAIYCWGANDFGQIGNGSSTSASSRTPARVSSSTGGYTMVATGADHACTVASNVLWCWGRNDTGQLGTGATGNSTTPVMGMASDVASIAAGKQHTCVLRTNGGVKCWGANGRGQLGNGGTSPGNILTPIDVIGLTSGVNSIAAGTNLTCALTSSKSVKCWGLGSGTPQTVISSGVSAIAVGSRHLCVLLTTGGVKCSGANTDGQLGNGTVSGTGSITSMVNVSGLASGVVRIAAGGDHTCAWLASNQITCWGDNAYGQLGNGTVIDRYVPTLVVGVP